MRPLFSRHILSCLTLTIILLLPTLAHAGKKTHLLVPIGDIINIETNVVPNDNSGGHEFRYDGGGGPVFSTPAGWSFVVTDVSAYPNTSSFASSNQYWVFINIDGGGSRTFSARWTGGGGFYQSLTTGMVMPPGTTPTARATTFSSDGVVVQIRGYFIKGNGLETRTSRF